MFDPKAKDLKTFGINPKNCAAIILIKWWICKITVQAIYCLFWHCPKESYGYNNGKFGFLLSKKIKNNIRNIPPVEHQFRILKMLGIDYDPELKLELCPSPKDEAYVQELLDSEWLSDAQVFVGLNISASAQWPTKNWPLEHMAKLCDILGQKNIRVILTGENKDKTLSQEINCQGPCQTCEFCGENNHSAVGGFN